MRLHGLTGIVIGAAMEVHSEIGAGFQELIYCRALALELQNLGIKYEREIEKNLFYKNYPKPIGTRRADFIIHDKLLVEIKAVSSLNNIHLAQTINYLKLYRLNVGLLINFGEKSLKFRRVAYG